MDTSGRPRTGIRALVWIACAAVGCAAPAATGGAAERTVLVIAAEPTPPEGLTGTGFRCDEGKRFDVGGRPYCAYERPSSWKAAERRCVDNGGHLMSLNTEATSEALRVALRSPLSAGRGVWIGLHAARRGSWAWVTGEPLSSPSWDAGEPNNFGGNEECGEWLAAGGTWNDTRCDLEQGYLCQALPARGKLTCSGRAFTIGGVAYCLYNSTPVAWADAKLGCEASGGALAVLRTPEDNRALREAMSARFPVKQMWMGFTDLGHEGTWGWVSRAKTGFTAWHEDEPNNFNGEDCGELYGDTWTWNDFDCGAPLPSVCEGPLH